MRKGQVCMEDEVKDLVTGLRESHERLARLVNRLPEAEVRRPAYPSEWTIADTLSHLGSGAEITSLILARARAREDEPVQADYVEIWDRWNAKPPGRQASDSIEADARLVEEVEALDPGALPTLSAYGGTMPLSDFLAMRLDEHVLHTWDVERGLDPSATIDPARLPHLQGRLAAVTARSAVAQPEPWTVRVAVTDPPARFRLHLGQEASLTADEESGPPDLVLPAEMFVRLLFGRLDPAEIEGRAEAGGDDRLRRLHGAFRGY
jgi:uncharacterized protein (TIGR03083 family)